jgi:hypothetical protein
MGVCKAAKRWSIILNDPKCKIRAPEGGVKIHFLEILRSISVGRRWNLLVEGLILRIPK